MEFQALEVAHQYVPGPVLQRERFAIVHGLQEGRLQVPADAFLLDDQFAFPEQVNEPALPVQLDARLETRHGVDGHPKDVEEVEVETLGLALLVPGLRPLLGELPGAASDFRPGKGHVHRHTTGRLSHSGLSESGIPAAQSIRSGVPGWRAHRRVPGGVRSRCADAQRCRCNHPRSQPVARPLAVLLPVMTGCPWTAWAGSTAAPCGDG